MDNRMLIFGLHEIEGVGWQSMSKLLNAFPELDRLLRLSASDLASCGIKRSVAERIASQFTPSFIERKLQVYMKHSIQFMTVLDEMYPPMLKEIAQPPWILYYKGNPALLRQKLIGIVGTRMPTHYGKKIASQLAAQLSDAGFGIVSGLARGIDSHAHQGSLQGKAKAVAVLGCGIDQVYPRENAPLYRQIEQQGVIVSEYPIGTTMHPGMFPQRNRIIAGLSLGIVVVEAAADSGSLITANYAVDESRDVFAVPGHITSPQSQGVYELLRKGARVVTRAQDIIDDYQYLLTGAEISVNQQPASRIELTAEETEIARMLSDTPVTIDELLERGEFTFGHLHAVLLSLVLKKAIKQLPGSSYVLA